MKLLWLRLLVPLLGETIDLKTTLLLVLRKSLVHVIEKHAAQLCVLAERFGFLFVISNQWVGEHMKNSGEVVQ
ncbi:hypothetical protein AAG906_030830 [Vitis piasezkii]